jgi:hypothetical protein
MRIFLLVFMGCLVIFSMVNLITLCAYADTSREQRRRMRNLSIAAVWIVWACWLLRHLP